MTDEIPQTPVDAKRRSLWDRVSIVWLVPLLALFAALSVAWQNYNDRGPVIEITFESAAGIAKDETELRFRDVTVGIVEGVRFTPSLDQVVVEVRLDKDAATFVDEDAEFWIVRPEVTTQGVSGLDTVLSGVYIEGLWDDSVGTLAYAFEGLDVPPLLPGGRAGLTLTMRATDGSLSGNTPIVFKGVEVGRIGPAMVALDGFSVEAEAVVYSPYDNLVTEATRFWDTSGFSLSVGASGAAVDFDSIASLIAGGVTFDTFVSGAELAGEGAEFTVFDSEDTARASVFNVDDGVTVELLATFDGNVAGLTNGASVELNGLKIGEVTGLNGVAETTPQGGTRVRLQAILSIQPSRLGMDGSGNAEEALRFLAGQVEGGLRARLVTGSIFTGGLKVQLVTLTGVPPATMDLSARPFPSIPVAASDITDVATTAQGTLDRIDDLPIEELLDSATAFLSNAAVLVGSAETQAVPGDVAALLADLRAVVGSQDVQELPEQLGSLMAELEQTVVEVRGILATVEEEDLVLRLGGAIDAAASLTTQLDTALNGVPALIEEVTALAGQAGELEIDALVSQITALADQGAALLGSDDVAALPAQVGDVMGTLRTTLAEASVTIADLNAGEGVDRLLAAVDAASGAAATVEGSFEGVPALIARLDAIAQDAEGLELDALIDQLTGLVNSADTLIASDDTRALPGELGAALDEVGAILAELRNGGAINNTNQALLAARQAADEIAAATRSLPALINQANALIRQADTTLGGFEDTSPAIRDARDALREVQEAADAVQSLARALERSPLLRR